MDRIYVAVRARPLSPEDANTSPWRISDNSISLAPQSNRFEFDRIFGEECKTKELYEERTKEIVASAVSGFNGTVFAYGQTSSGKTHTMRGSKYEPGIIPLAIQDLFNIVEKDENREFLMRVSYMEIYNEEINDLLVPEHRKLQIHENQERGIYVAGLKEEIVTYPEQVLRLMDFGESHRHIGETNMNLYSSRSHSIFRMIIESREKVEGDMNDSTDAVRVSILNLVDLAGSERVAKTGAEGKRFKEGSHINKSLLTLGNVIKKLSEGAESKGLLILGNVIKKLSEGAESKGGHVPYRDSKLTRILEPALGGNANTAMICNITLALMHADETKNSLKFASRALRVQNHACVNEILTDAALLKRQRKEIEELRDKLKSSHNEHWEEEILNLRNTLLQSELEKERIFLELEEEKKEKAEREQRLIEQAKKIENLSSLVLNSDRDEKTINLLKTQKKRRVTWCPGPFTNQFINEDSSSNESDKTKRASSGAALLPFSELIEDENESLIVENENKEDLNENENEIEIPLLDTISLFNVTSRRKHNSKKSSIEMEKTGKNINDSNSSPDEKVEKLTMRESEAILVIKQLEDQIKLLELEKSSIQNNLDDVVELATQQNNSFAEKHKEMEKEVEKAREETRIAQEKLSSAPSLEDFIKMQEEVAKALEEARISQEKLSSAPSIEDFIKMQEEIVKAREEARVSQEKLSSAPSLEHFKQMEQKVAKALEEARVSQEKLSFAPSVEDFKQMQQELAKAKEEAKIAQEKLSSITLVHEIKQESANFTPAEILEEITGLELQIGQSKNMTDNLFETCSLLFKDLKSSLSEDISLFKSKFGEFEMITKKLTENSNKLEFEKNLLQSQIVDYQQEIEKLKSDLESREKDMDELTAQHKFEKDEICKYVSSQMVSNSNQSSANLLKEIESLKKELERTKNKLKETDSKLKNSIQDKIKLESERAQAAREIKQLTSQRALLERDIRKNETKIDKSLLNEYQNLELRAVEIFEEKNSLQAEKDEAFAHIELLNSQIEDYLIKINSAESQIISLKDEVAYMAQRLREDESLNENLKASIDSLNKEKDEMAMQLTDALLEAEAEKSTWSNKEKNFIQTCEKLKISHNEIQKLSKDLSEAKSKLEVSSEENIILKNSIEKLTSEKNSLAEECKKEVSNRISKCDELNKIKDELNMLIGERDELLLKIKDLNQKLLMLDNYKDLESQLKAVKKERQNLIIENEKMSFEAEILKNNYEQMSQAKSEREKFSARITDNMTIKKELVKYRLRSRALQDDLDFYKMKFEKSLNDRKKIEANYLEASNCLKEKIRDYANEILNLNEQRKELQEKIKV